MSGFVSRAIAAQATRIRAQFVVTAVSVTATTTQVTRGTGSWIADGVRVGMQFTTTLTGNTSGVFTITAVSATVLTVTPNLTAVGSSTPADFTFRVPLGEVTDFDGPGGSNSEIDITSFDSTSREFRNGLTDSGEVSLSMNFVPGDVGQVFLRQRQAVTNTPTTFVITFTDAAATTATFAAFVREFTVAGATDDKVSASVTLRVTGNVAWSDIT